MADLFTLVLFADLFSAVRASLRRRSNEESDDGVAYGRHAWLRWRSVDFFPRRLCKAPVLKESISDHGHEYVTMKALPGSSFQVIKSEFLFQLLMDLFANPSGLDRGS